MVYIPVESQEPKPEIPQVQTLPCPVPAFSVKTTYSSFMGLLSRSAQYLCLKLRDAPTGADGKWCYLHCVSHEGGALAPSDQLARAHSSEGRWLGRGRSAIHCARGSVTCCFLSCPTV